MGRLHFVVALSLAGPLLSAPALDGGEPLHMRLSPAISMAPGFVTVEVRVETAAENRMLQVVAESPDFYRSSQIELKGAQAPPIAVFEFRNLPSGLYQVTSVLGSVNGRRAMTMGLAKVQPSPGR